MQKDEKNKFHNAIKEKKWLMADGATGTNLFDMGLKSGDAPELWNIDHPDKIETLHDKFIKAHCDIILTNSFGGNARRLELHKAQDRVHEINATAAQIARKSANKTTQNIIIAGSMGPTGDIFQPVGNLSIEDGAKIFAQQAKALKQGGADILWIETLSSLEEMKAALLGCVNINLPVAITMSFDTNGRTMMGITPKDFAKAAQTMPRIPDAIGANCGTGAAQAVAAAIDIKNANPDTNIIAKGNCGIPYYKDGKICYSGTPELMGEYMRMALDAGATIIGGCCGTTYAHLKAMHKAVQNYQIKKQPSIDEIEASLGPVLIPDIVAKSENSRRQSRRRVKTRPKIEP